MRQILIFICGLMLLVGMQEAKAERLQYIVVPSEGEPTTYGDQYVSYVNNNIYQWNEYSITPKYSGTCTITISHVANIISGIQNTVAFGLGGMPPINAININRVSMGETKTFSFSMKAGKTYRFIGYLEKINGIIGKLQSYYTITFKMPPKPVVTVGCSSGGIREVDLINPEGINFGNFILRRSNTEGDLTVGYTLSGTAIPGTDYLLVIGDTLVVWTSNNMYLATFPDGTDTITLITVPQWDKIAEPTESMTLSILPSPDYTVGSQGSATVEIYNDPPPIKLMEISGDNRIGNQSYCDYRLFVTYYTYIDFTDGWTGEITVEEEPEWTLSSTAYATLGAGGVVTNRSMVTEDQTVTLNASFAGLTAPPKTITLSPKYITGISIDGPASIATAGTANYTCTATWSDGSTSPVMPIWSLSSTSYASVKTGGVVTNKNTTTSNQTTTLKATYTFNGITKTDSKTITLEKKILKSIAISGDANIATAKTASYTCTATWSYGPTSNVTSDATWSLSSTTYASVSTGGVVTNKNTTTTDQTVKLNASYMEMTASPKAITLAKKTLKSIAISGDASIATASTATYACTATWSYGPTSPVTPTWSLSSTNYASVNTNGVVTNKNTTTTDQKVALNASYTINDVTETASKKGITLAAKVLTGISISGNSTIATASTASYTCTATWSDGTTSNVTSDATWSLSSTTYASVSTGGVVTNKNTTTTDQTVKLNASYMEMTASPKTITLAKKTLKSIAISGDASIATASTATYACTATWSYGPTSPVTPTWSLSSTTYASVNTNGVVTNKNTTTTDQTVKLNASYMGEICQKDITLTGMSPQSILELKSGWNWVSFQRLPTSHKIGDVLGSSGLTANDVIQSSAGSSRFNGASWIPSSFTLEYGKLYMVYVSKPVSVKLTGAESGSSTLSVSSGWNWIANPTSTAVTPSQLTHSGGWTAGDCIQGSSGSVTYSGSKWIPSTGFTLEPGKGYQIRSAKASMITF